MPASTKRRQWWGYDAAKLSAAYGNPVLCIQMAVSQGLLGMRGKYSSKIEIRYHEPGLQCYHCKLDLLYNFVKQQCENRHGIIADFHTPVRKESIWTKIEKY